MPTRWWDLERGPTFKVGGSVLWCIDVTLFITSFSDNVECKFEAFCDSAPQWCADWACGDALSAVIPAAWQCRGDLGRKSGVGADWHGCFWWQAAITLRVAGQPSWPMHMHHDSPRELGTWPVSRKGTIWKVCEVLIFFPKPSPKQKK